MKRRAPSPTLSENEVDIAGDLFGDESDRDEPPTTQPVKGAKTAPADDLDFGDLLGAGGDSSDDGDAEFIASRQRSSNRKASNLPGKSLKKGGGFQAMGKL
jgi:ATP-dependent RNA helicase DDX54/DBP10